MNSNKAQLLLKERKILIGKERPIPVITVTTTDADTSNALTTSYFDLIPPHLVEWILSYLTIADLLSCKLVCKKWKEKSQRCITKLNRKQIRLKRTPMVNLISRRNSITDTTIKSTKQTLTYSADAIETIQRQEPVLVSAATLYPFVQEGRSSEAQNRYIADQSVRDTNRAGNLSSNSSGNETKSQQSFLSIHSFGTRKRANTFDAVVGSSKALDSPLQLSKVTNDVAQKERSKSPRNIASLSPLSDNTTSRSRALTAETVPTFNQDQSPSEKKAWDILRTLVKKSPSTGPNTSNIINNNPLSEKQVVSHWMKAANNANRFVPINLQTRSTNSGDGWFGTRGSNKEPGYTSKDVEERLKYLLLNQATRSKLQNAMKKQISQAIKKRIKEIRGIMETERQVGNSLNILSLAIYSENNYTDEAVYEVKLTLVRYKFDRHGGCCKYRMWSMDDNDGLVFGWPEKINLILVETCDETPVTYAVDVELFLSVSQLAIYYKKIGLLKKELQSFECCIVLMTCMREVEERSLDLGIQLREI